MRRGQTHITVDEKNFAVSLLGIALVYKMAGAEKQYETSDLNFEIKLVKKPSDIGKFVLKTLHISVITKY